MCESRKSKTTRSQLARWHKCFYFLSFCGGVSTFLFVGVLVLLSAVPITVVAATLLETPVPTTTPVSTTLAVATSATQLVSTEPTKTTLPSIAINANTSENKTSGNLTPIISACISAMVTIFGFVITYFLNMRNFKEAVNKQKIDIQLSKIADLPYTLLSFFDFMNTKVAPVDLLPKFKEIMSLIYAYGSKNSIKLAARMQEVNYEIARNPDGIEKISAIAYYILLACQTKYDLTGIKISPEYWYRMRMNEYSQIREKIKNINNDIVNILQLESFMLID